MIGVDPNTPLFVISVAARLTGLHEQTIRIYERKGLVEPSRTGNKMRLFSENDIKRLKFITHLTRNLGINTAGVKMILKMVEDIDKELEAIMEQPRNEPKTPSRNMRLTITNNKKRL